MERGNNYGRNTDWSAIKTILKERYSADGINTHSNVNDGSSNNEAPDYWNRFQSITGVSKENFKEKFRRM